MASEKEYRFDIFFDYFANDLSKYLLPRMPYYDNIQTKRVIDLAIISNSPCGPKIAVLVRPEEKDRTALQQKELKKAMEILKAQNWQPLVVSPRDLAFRPKYIKMQLDDLLHPAKVRRNKRKHGNSLALLKPFSFKPLYRETAALLTVFAVLGGMSFFWAAHAAIKDYRFDPKPFRSNYHYAAPGAKYAHSGLGKSTGFSVEMPRSFDREALPKDSPDMDKPALSYPVSLPDHLKKETQPIIDWDEVKSLPQPQAPQSDEEKSKTKAPIYLATVRYCTSGLDCVLQDDTKITLWGVQLPDDPEKQAQAMVTLNQQLAGRKVGFEVRRNLGDRLVVKIKQGQQDVAMSIVEKGLLVPNEEGTIYEAWNRPGKAALQLAANQP